MPDRSVTVYFVPGPRPALIDTGPDTPEAKEALSAGLADAGIEPAELAQILVTHTHRDHAGLAGWLAKESGASVLVHPLGLPRLADPGATLAEQRARVAAILAAAAVPDGRSAAVMSAVSALPRVPENQLRPVTSKTRPNLAGKTWRILETPGHTPDHLAWLDPSGGILVAGDLVERSEPTRHTLTGLAGTRPHGADRLDQLLESWRSVGKLALEQILPGHGPAIRAPRVLIARRIAGTRQRLRDARDAVRGGADTVWQVLHALNPGPVRDGALIGLLGESVALLEWLTHRGVLSRERRDIFVVYRLAPKAKSPRAP